LRPLEAVVRGNNSAVLEQLTAASRYQSSHPGKKTTKGAEKLLYRDEGEKLTGAGEKT